MERCYRQKKKKQMTLLEKIFEYISGGCFQIGAFSGLLFLAEITFGFKIIIYEVGLKIGILIYFFTFLLGPIGAVGLIFSELWNNFGKENKKTKLSDYTKKSLPTRSFHISKMLLDSLKSNARRRKKYFLKKILNAIAHLFKLCLLGFVFGTILTYFFLATFAFAIITVFGFILEFTLEPLPYLIIFSIGSLVFFWIFDKVLMKKFLDKKDSFQRAYKFNLFLADSYLNRNNHKFLNNVIEEGIPIGLFLHNFEKIESINWKIKLKIDEFEIERFKNSEYFNLENKKLVDLHRALTAKFKINSIRETIPEFRFLNKITSELPVFTFSNWKNPFPYDNLIHLYSQNENWQNLVSELIKISSLIIIFVEEISEGIAIELGLINEAKANNRAIIIYDPDEIDLSKEVLFDCFSYKFPMYGEESILNNHLNKILYGK